MTSKWDNEPDLLRLRRAHDLLTTNPSEALKEFRALADRGSLMSKIYLADAYCLGIGTQINIIEAEHWYRCAANSGSPLGYYELGKFFSEMGDYSRAVEALSASAAQNYAPAITLLGVHYLEGNGVERDLIKARSLFERAVALGHVFAKRKLAVLLTPGHFGASGVIKGLLLFLSGIKDVLVVASTDPSSDRLK